MPHARDVPAEGPATGVRKVRRLVYGPGFPASATTSTRQATSATAPVPDERHQCSINVVRCTYRDSVAAVRRTRGITYPTSRTLTAEEPTKAGSGSGASRMRGDREANRSGASRLRGWRGSWGLRGLRGV